MRSIKVAYALEQHFQVLLSVDNKFSLDDAGVLKLVRQLYLVLDDLKLNLD